MDNLLNKKNGFNKKRYGNHQALKTEDRFFKDKVYYYKIYRFIQKLGFNNSGKKILEVGCADGSFLRIFKKQGFDVYGIDAAISQSMKEFFDDKKIIQGDIEAGLGFENNFFDVIVACEVIEHLFDTDFFLSELSRVAKNNGYLFLSTPNLASLKNRIKLLFGKYPQYSEYNIEPESAGHIRNYTPEVLVKQLKVHGWKIIKVTSPNIACPMAKDIPLIIKKIAMFLGDIFHSIGSHIIVVAKKYEE